MRCDPCVRFYTTTFALQGDFTLRFMLRVVFTLRFCDARRFYNAFLRCKAFLHCVFCDVLRFLVAYFALRCVFAPRFCVMLSFCVVFFALCYVSAIRFLSKSVHFLSHNMRVFVEPQHVWHPVKIQLIVYYYQCWLCLNCIMAIGFIISENPRSFANYTN